jgi:predicted DNA-binding transcriptional regulator AlpA
MSISEVTETPRQRIHTHEFPAGKERFIDINEVSHRTGYSKSTLWAKVAADEFVQPIRIKAGVTRWREFDIDAWMDDVIEASRKEASVR